MSKSDFRKIFNEACKSKDEETQRRQANEKKKCDRIMEDTYGQKGYFQNQNIAEARTMFKTRTGLLPFAGNYSNSNRYKQTNWLCICKQNREEEHHIRTCLVYQDIREKFGSLDDDENLVQFFSEVLARREALEEEDAGGQGAADTLLAGETRASHCGGEIPA